MDEQPQSAAALARRRLAETRRAITRVYLAGKIGKHDWRHALAEVGLNDGVNRMPQWEPVPMRWRRLECVGPFFVSCDHGCAHGPNDHGVGASEPGCVNEPLRQREVFERCLRAIDECDVVFAWLDDPTAHGTLVEIGYAKAKGKYVVVATHPHIRAEVRRDMWFAFAAADDVVDAADAVSAFWSSAWTWPFKTQS